MLLGVESSFDQLAPSAGAAVHFAKPTKLYCASLAATDNGYFSFSLWLNGSIALPFNGAQLWEADYGTNYVPSCSAAVVNTMRVYAGTGSNKFWNTYTTPNGWNHYLGSIDSNQAAGARVQILYINDSPVSPSSSTDIGSAIVNAFNGKSFSFGDDGSNLSGIDTDVADVWIAPGIALHDGGGTIPEATRRQFINADLTPADVSGFPDSAILFSGNASSFPINRGSGGSFTLTGTLTDASTHP